MVSDSDYNKPNNQIPIKNIYLRLAERLKRSSQEWTIIIRLFENNKQIYASVLEIKDGKFIQLEKIPKKPDFILFIKKDAWWELIRGNLPPMQAIYEEKMRINGFNLDKVYEFFQTLINLKDKNKIIYFQEGVSELV